MASVGHQATPPTPRKGRGQKRLSSLFTPSSTPLPNSRETSRNSASAHYTTLGVKAPREGEGKGGDGANGVAAILFVAPLRALSVLRDARFPLPSAVSGPLYCLTLQECGGGSWSSVNFVVEACECVGASVGGG